MSFLDIIGCISTNPSEDNELNEPVAPFTQVSGVTTPSELDATPDSNADDVDVIDYDDISSNATTGLRHTRTEAGLDMLEAEYSERMKKRIREYVDKVATELEIVDEKDNLQEFAMVRDCSFLYLLSLIFLSTASPRASTYFYQGRAARSTPGEI